jgi:hypothetical protein
MFVDVYVLRCYITACFEFVAGSKGGNGKAGRTQES